MKILYGVSGEGSGHSSRARLIGQWLLEQGHQLKMASYNRGYNNLKDDFDLIEIVGLSIVSVNNEVSKLKTITENLAKLPRGSKALKSLRKTIEQFKPDVVITDFEPCTAYLANSYNLPLISLDNQHRMRYMEYEIPPGFKNDARMTKTIIRAMIPKPWVSLITTFHRGPLRNQRSFLFPPILRQEVLALQPSPTDHILVYATSGFESLLTTLKAFTRESFIVYGFGRDDSEGNIQFKGFSKEGFLGDLASSKAVIATAGFTLITESLYLGKPYLALPMQGQFEQHLNAHRLEAMGFGLQTDSPSDKEVAAFLYKIPDIERLLQDYPRNGNEQIQAKLAQLLSNNGEELQRYKR